MQSCKAGWPDAVGSGPVGPRPVPAGRAGTSRDAPRACGPGRNEPGKRLADAGPGCVCGLGPKRETCPVAPEAAAAPPRVVLHAAAGGADDAVEAYVDIICI